MKGKTILEDSDALGLVVETAVFCHLSSRNTSNHLRFTYWKDPRNKELDLIIETPEELIPLEIKYKNLRLTFDEIPALIHFCQKKTSIKQAYVVTKSHQDLGLLKNHQHSCGANMMRIPASILCYWLGESEIKQQNIL